MSIGRRIGRWALNLTMLGVSVLFSAGIFEVGLRLLGYQAIHDLYSKPSQFWVADPVLGWRHEPGSQDLFVGPRPWPIEFETEVRINAAGLRGPEIPADKGDERRVLFLGDSMVAAFEVPYEQSYVALVGEALTERLGAPVRTINGGVRGYGTDQSLLHYRTRVREHAPDVVVFFHAGNDARNNTTLHRMRREYGKPAFALVDGRLELKGSPVPAYPKCSSWSLRSDGEAARLDGRAARFGCAIQGTMIDHSALLTFIMLRVPWNPASLGRLYSFGAPKRKVNSISGNDHTRSLTTALVLELAREVEADGGSFVLMSEEPHRVHLDEAKLSEAGIEVVSTQPIEGESKREVRFVHDSHFNPIGHQRVAALLTPIIEARLRAAAEAR